jgi:two-component system nitrogen regulation sensor histidine kinase GlnL
MQDAVSDFIGVLYLLCFEPKKMRLRSRKTPVTSQISWENILASLEDAVIVIDLEDRISFFNQAAETLTDLSASQAAGQPFSILLAHNPWIVALLKNNRPLQSSARSEGDFVTARRRRVPVNLTLSPLQDRTGGILGTTLVLRDLTHRKELEEDLKRSDRLAQLGVLAAGLAHEIKNPLGGIRGSAQLLRRSLARDGSLLECTDIMVREVDRVNRLIEQLLDLSRPVRLQSEALNIHEVLDEVLFLEAQTIDPENFKIRKDFDPSLPAIWGDREQLTQVFLNLVKNGVEAMNGRGCLTVSTRIETDFHIREPGKGRAKFIWIDIKDEGPGIREEDLPHIFSPFFTTKNNGTGLGLATAYRVVKEHGGLIRVDSRAGTGAVFKVSLLVAD